MPKRAISEESKEDRRNFILSCAEEIVKTNGLSGLNIQSVAKKSGFATGTIYLYFANKEDLIAHLTLDSRKELLRIFEKSIVGEGLAMKQLSKVMEAFFHFYETRPHYYELVSFFEKNTGLEEPEELELMSRKINQLVADILKKGKKQGHIRNDLDEMTFSFLLWGSSVGILQLLEVKKSIIKRTLNTDSFDFFSKHIELVLHAIKVD